MAWVKFLICLFFGYLGIHKFMEKKIAMGILYLFTLGLLGFGWIFDCIKYLILAIKSASFTIAAHARQSDAVVKTAIKYPPVEIPAEQGFSIEKALLWVLVAFLTIIGLANLPHFSGIIALAAAVIVAPIEKWQMQISRFIKVKSKAIIVAAMTLVAIFTTPTADSPEVDRSGPNTAIVETTDPTTILPTVGTSEIPAIPPTKPEGASFFDENCIVGVGRTVDIPFTLYPENAISDTLEATVDNTENAVLSFEKKHEHIIQITGLIPGEVIITLKSDEAVIATNTITIAEVMPQGMTIKAEPKAPQIGSSGVFTVEFDPQDVTNQSITWHSDSPDVLKVSEDGSFEAISVGEAAITATHESGVSGSILLEVLPVQVDRINLSTNWEDGKPFCKGNSMTLTAEVLPENATDKSITWTSSDESVVTVSDGGVVTAVSRGTALITVTASNGKKWTYQITVDPTPQKFRVSISIQMQSNDHVGNNWTKGAEFNDEDITSGAVVSIMPGETFCVRGWAQDNDSNPDYGSYFQQTTLTDEMCSSGFTIEGNANIRENGGRYRGNSALWYVTLTFTPIN